MNSKTPLLTPAEVASQFGVSPITVRAWVNKGWLKATVTPGGHRRFTPEDVNNLAREYGPDAVKAELVPEQTRILIVDDNEHARGYLVEFFNTVHPPVEIVEAVDGFQAGLMTAAFKPHIILLDYSMPGLSGAAVCKQLKACENHLSTRIIAMTGHASESVRQELMDAGAETVLTKPISLSVLTETLSLSVSIEA